MFFLIALVLISLATWYYRKSFIIKLKNSHIVSIYNSLAAKEKLLLGNYAIPVKIEKNKCCVVRPTLNKSGELVLISNWYNFYFIKLNNNKMDSKYQVAKETSYFIKNN